MRSRKTKLRRYKTQQLVEEGVRNTSFKPVEEISSSNNSSWDEDEEMELRLQSTSKSNMSMKDTSWEQSPISMKISNTFKYEGLGKLSSSSYALTVILAVGIVLFILLIMIIIILIINKRRLQRRFEQRILAIPNKCVLERSKYTTKNTYLNEKELRKKFVLDESSPWMLDKANLIVFHELKLGSGAFCDVYKGAIKGLAPICKINASLIAYGTFKDCTCAVKMLPPFADDIARSDFLQEVKFMQSLKYHPHLVSMLGVCEDADHNLMLLIEFCEQGDLLHFVRSKKDQFIRSQVCGFLGLKIKDLVSFAWQISDGLEYLSGIGCVHRDVAARNVLVTATNICKIGDFGLCRLSDSFIYTGRGGRLPLKWMAPESLKLYEYSVKTDVWSFGVVLYEIFSFGEVPYALIQVTEIYDFLESGGRLSKPEYCPVEIYTMMLQCWQFDPALRPTFTEIRSFLRSILENSSEYYGYIKTVEESPTDQNQSQKAFEENIEE